MISTKNYQELTPENIFKKISGYDIFKYYIPDFKNVQTSFKSPLRVDKKADVRIFKTRSGDFMYKDFAKPEHTFNSLKFVQELYNESFRETLQRINDDFHLNLGLTRKSYTKPKPTTVTQEYLDNIKGEKHIRIVSKPADYFNSMYFHRHKISVSTLNKFKVKPIKGYFLNFNYFPCKGTAFAYCFGNYKYKILQPYDLEFKWLSNTENTIIQGWEQLPEKGTICFITSSLKDVMVLHEIGYNAVAPQSEAGSLPEEVVDELKRRFEHVIIFYDSDKPGMDAARKLQKQTGFDVVYLPDMIEEKDPADYAKNHGLGQLQIIVDSIL